MPGKVACTSRVISLIVTDEWMEAVRREHMKLKTLVGSLVVAQTTGNTDVDIEGIEVDSRQVKPGDLFVALKGFTVDGHEYISQAVEKGAAAVVVEEEAGATGDVPVVRVPDTRRAMAVLAGVLYRHPSQEMKVIGVTGTNGKTTTSHLIREILQDRGRKTGLIGTIHMSVDNDVYPVKNTTPEAVDLQRGFRKMADAGCSHAVMEASS